MKNDFAAGEVSYRSSGFEPEEMMVVLMAVTDKIAEFQYIVQHEPLEKSQRRECLRVRRKLESAKEKLLEIFEVAGLDVNMIEESLKSLRTQ